MPSKSMPVYQKVLKEISEYEARQLGQKPEALFINPITWGELVREFEPLKVTSRLDDMGTKRARVANLWVYLDGTQETLTVGKLS